MNTTNDTLESMLMTLSENIEGDVFTDNISRTLYSTDASAYKETPLGVVRPKNVEDIKKIVSFASENSIPVIPRTAGTSLAGQVVGSGLVVDVSRYMNSILEINKEEKYVWVEPGVVLDELNKELEKYGLFFGPETSTSNRCMIGGMVGNNSCGSHSLIYGNTRQHTLEIKGFLSNGEEVVFGSLSDKDFKSKCKQDNFEGAIYRGLNDILSNKENREEILKEFPHPEIERRNTGYAIDLLSLTSPFEQGGESFNMCKLIAGSEGTLCFITAIKLNLVDVPPKEKGVVCAHFNSLDEAYKANIVAREFNPGAIELMDKAILDLAAGNGNLKKNKFFIKGDPKAILIVEFARHTRQGIDDTAEKLKEAMKSEGFGYAFTMVYGKEISKIWQLRKAGLGVLSNMKGDAKPVPVIEDTAVRPEDLPAYMKDFTAMLDGHGKECVYYAHIGTGELHLRPVLNLKDEGDVKLFREIARDTAILVKKYRGSLSGEHGDGRLRGEFIPLMIGDKNYKLLKDVKDLFDPNHILNPGKIVDTPVMNTSLRHRIGKKDLGVKTYFDWSEKGGFLEAAERCTGSGDCRKTHIIGGTMCPSYMGTRNEQASTRARANILREFLNNSTKKNPFDHKEIYEVLDLCLSCKACKSECPSSVDMARLKAEFLQHYYDVNGIPFRTKLIGYFPSINKLFSPFAGLYNIFAGNKFVASFIKKTIGFANERSLPLLSKTTLKKWDKKRSNEISGKRKVYLFADEFINYNESEIGIKAIMLLEKLGYNVVIPKHVESGRTFLSKGMVKQAAKIANKNVDLLSDLISSDTPLIGIEPSAILSFRDEYPVIVNTNLKQKAKELSRNCLLIDEFLEQEIDAGNISSDSFTKEKKHIKLHGHCFQKSLSSTACTLKLLSLPENFTAEEIPSGCCGMAGSFGFEKEHYKLSKDISELVLLPEIRKTPQSVLISAPGTSCRQQIADGANREALHPVEILFDALK
jgi:FAD/FMN-containing dehydrogenase/Fe-S oxidoreductase